MLGSDRNARSAASRRARRITGVEQGCGDPRGGLGACRQRACRHIKEEESMTRRVSAVLSALIVGVLVAASPAAHAQAPSDFASEPDKSMAKAQDSFGKGDMKAAAAHIQKAAGYVRNEAGKVAKDAKDGVTKAADELSSLGTEVKRGAVKSGDQLKKTFAQVDYARARAWHATAEQAQKTGRNATSALRSAGAGVEGAA